jgi:uncharacterized protein (TIGR03066 family)
VKTPLVHLLCFACLSLVLLSSAGCGLGLTKSSQIVGTWESAEASVDGKSVSHEKGTITMKLTADNKLSQTMKIPGFKTAKQMDGTYKVEGDKLTTTIGGTSTTGTIKSLSSSELVLATKEGTIKYVRK